MTKIKRCFIFYWDETELLSITTYVSQKLIYALHRFAQTGTKVLTSTIFENLSPSGGFSERSYNWEGEKKLTFCMVCVAEYIEKKKKNTKKIMATASKVLDTILHARYSFL